MKTIPEHYQRPRIIYMTGIPGTDRKTLCEQVLLLAQKHNKHINVIRTSDLIEYAYSKLNIPPPNFTKILNWDTATEQFAMQSACSFLDMYICEHEMHTSQHIIIIGHATFFHAYKRFLLRPAVTAQSLALVKPSLLLHIVDNPRHVEQRNKNTQWSYLTVDDIAKWACDEYRQTLTLATQLQDLHAVQTKAITMARRDHIEVLYNILFNDEAPIAYFSYPITGSTEEKEHQAYLKEVLQLKHEVSKRFIVVGHECGIEKEDFSLWPGAVEFLQTIQLDMLISQANAQISAYLRNLKTTVPEISAGVQVEQATSDNKGLKTYLLHKRKFISLYQSRHADAVAQTIPQLMQALDADGFTIRSDIVPIPRP